MSEIIVTGDLPCVRCGYNLRSLRWDSACPECNTPTEESRLISGFNLCRRDASRLRRGLGLMIGGVFLYTIDYIWASITFMNALQMPRQWFRWCVVTWQIGEPLAGIVQVLGLWQVSTVLVRLGFKRTRTVVLVIGSFAAASLVFVVATLVWHYWLGPGRGPIAQFGFKYIQPLVWPSLGFALILVFFRLPSVVDSQSAVRLRALLRVCVISVLVPIHDLVYSVILADELIRGQNLYDPWHLFDVFWWWRQHGYAACWVVLLLIVLVFVRRLDQAMKSSRMSA